MLPWTALPALPGCCLLAILSPPGHDDRRDAQVREQRRASRSALELLPHRDLLASGLERSPFCLLWVLPMEPRQWRGSTLHSHCSAKFRDESAFCSRCGNPLAPAEVLKAEVRAWAKRIGLEPRTITVHPMKRKWGSCTTKGNLTFTSELLGRPADFRARVIAKELLHLKVPNHGKLFKALLKSYLGQGR